MSLMSRLLVTLFTLGTGFFLYTAAAVLLTLLVHDPVQYLSSDTAVRAGLFTTSVLPGKSHFVFGVHSTEAASTDN